MWFADIFCIMGWLLIAFAKDYWWLDFGRLAIGFAVGLISYVVSVVWRVVHISVTYSCYLSHYSTILAITIQAAVYISEIAPRNIRGVFTSAGSVIKIIIYLDQRTNSICLPCAYILPIYCSWWCVVAFQCFISSELLFPGAPWLWSVTS